MAYAEKRVSTAKGSKGKVSWRARYMKPDGTLGSESGFPTKNTAEKWGEEQEAAIRAGRWIDPDLMRKTFGTFSREFMKARQPSGNTVATRWRMLREVILPKWEHTPLIAINWFEVEAWANTHPAHETELNHSVSLMSTILTAAVDAKHLLVNPLYGRRRSTSSGSAATKAKKAAAVAKAKEQRAATPEIVLQVAERLGPARGLHVLTTAFQGLRWGEGAGLHRDNVLRIREERFEGGIWRCPVIRIDPDVGELQEYDLYDEDGNRKGIFLGLGEPKTPESVRDIDVPPFLAVLLNRHLQEWRWPYVFSPDSKGTFWRRSNWSGYLRPAVNGRKVEERRQGTKGKEAWAPIMPGLTMDILRHTHDTFQEEIGVKAALSYEQAGHKRPGIKAVYRHPTVPMRIERLAGLEDLFWTGMRTLGWKSLWGREVGPGTALEDDLPKSSQMITESGDREALPQVKEDQQPQ